MAVTMPSVLIASGKTANVSGDPDSGVEYLVGARERVGYWMKGREDGNASQTGPIQGSRERAACGAMSFNMLQGRVLN